MAVGAWDCLLIPGWIKRQGAQIRSEASQVVTPPNCPLKNPHSLVLPRLLKQLYQLRTRVQTFEPIVGWGAFHIPVIKDEHSVSAMHSLLKWSSYVFSVQGLFPHRVSRKITNTYTPRSLGMVSMKEAAETPEGEHPRCSDAVADISKLGRKAYWGVNAWPSPAHMTYARSESELSSKVPEVVGLRLEPVSSSSTKLYLLLPVPFHTRHIWPTCKRQLMI